MTSPAARKLIVTAATAVLALAVFLLVINSKRGGTGQQPAQPTTPAAAGGDAAPAQDGSSKPDAPPPPPVAQQATPPTGLLARAPTGGFDAGKAPTPIGSLNPKTHPFRVVFAPHAAGVESITFSEYWKTVADSQQARRHARAEGREGAPPMPPEGGRYVLARAETIAQREGTKTVTVPVFAVHSIEIDGAIVPLFGNVWSEAAPGTFASEIVDADGAVRFRIEREYRIKERSYGLLLRQTVTNLGTQPSKVRWVQYGPSDLVGDPAMYIDVRRYHFGYLLPPSRDPDQATVLATGQMYEHSAVSKLVAKGAPILWPNESSTAGDYSVSWFGATSRYFALCVHAPSDTVGADKRLTGAIEEVRMLSNGAPAPNEALISELHSPAVVVLPAGTASFDVGVYAGPLDPEVLGGVEPYAGLGMQQLIVYLLSGCCTFCTFAWLANLLAAFLGLLHDYLVFDWGLAIIVLVVVVRLLLHPLMKRSQVQMQRFSRGMAELKPELDALQKRFKDDPAKLQAEQVRLYREKNINPVGCVSGLAPTFLQMPIWMALYAVLFFSWDLRQSPAFFGIFQLFGGWTFLGDLSRADSFISFPAVDLRLFTLDAINILPILMGVVFFLQQKYATPPTPNMTPEQESQQKMMKWMMVLMFPVMLYKAPSGLTLYILTSTMIGIWESKMVKAHIDRYGMASPKKGEPKKKQDRLGRLYEDALERARQRQADKNKRTFKERD